MKQRGFTLIELLVVIGIIGMLSSVLLSNINVVRARGRDLVRIQNIKTLQTALEIYYTDYGHYPETFSGAIGNLETLGECFDNPTDYIPELVPTYISQLPSDPLLDCDGVTHSWTYASNGTDYKLVTHVEGSAFSSSFNDPAWDDGEDPCILDGSTRFHYGGWTYGARCWEI